MMGYLADYVLFLAKISTWVIALLVLTGGLVAILARNKGVSKEKLRITPLNEQYEDIADALQQEILSKDELKLLAKQQKQEHKKNKKEKIEKPRVYVLEFDGDVAASAVHNLRQEITAILTIAKPKEEVLIKIESAGGLVHSYGLAASQVQRLRDHGLHVVVAVDKVAASGGYLMACVADKIIAAPFAVIGSIGVIAQVPNFHRLLKKHDVDFEQITAGEYKRTITMFGENTEKGREKFKEELEDVHQRFKDFVQQHRQQVNINEVATGEHWLASKALELKLVDELMTSDDYLLAVSKKAHLFELMYEEKKSFLNKLLDKAAAMRGAVWL